MKLRRTTPLRLCGRCAAVLRQLPERYLSWKSPWNHFRSHGHDPRPMPAKIPIASPPLPGCPSYDSPFHRHPIRRNAIPHITFRFRYKRWIAPSLIEAQSTMRALPQHNVCRHILIIHQFYLCTAGTQHEVALRLLPAMQQAFRAPHASGAGRLSNHTTRKPYHRHSIQRCYATGTSASRFASRSRYS